jgi:hypothetical protein
MKDIDDKDLVDVSGGIDSGQSGLSGGSPGGAGADLDTTKSGGTTADGNQTTGQGGHDGAQEVIS